MIKTEPTDTFNINWEANSPIIIPISGNYTLKFFIFYNCYQTKNSFTDCNIVKDKLTVYMKSYISEEYNVLKEYSLSKINNTNNWKEIKINIPNMISSNSKYVNLKNYILF